VQAVDTSGLPIGRALKVERVAAGVSSTAIAAAVGISIGHLSHIEAGRRTASDELIVRIREAITRSRLA
jgi:transcriptional regulator with XRE-family HTH domain